MQVKRDDGLGGRGIHILPPSGTYSNVVVWFHGLGDTANGWASMMPSLGLTNTKFILPTAPIRSISLNGGTPLNGWADILGLDPESEEDRAGLEESAARVEALVAAELARGLAPERIIIGGFSQGGALALHYSLRSTRRLGGCVALSTWLPLRGDYPAAASEEAKNHLDILQVRQIRWDR